MPLIFIADQLPIWVPYVAALLFTVFFYLVFGLFIYLVRSRVKSKRLSDPELYRAELITFEDSLKLLHRDFDLFIAMTHPSEKGKKAAGTISLLLKHMSSLSDGDDGALLQLGEQLEEVYEQEIKLQLWITELYEWLKNHPVD